MVHPHVTHQQCHCHRTTRMDLSPDSANPMYQLRFLWQNTAGFGFFQCIPSLSLLTSINIAPENVIRNTSSDLTLSLQVTFCLSNITILPSTLVSEGQHLFLAVTHMHCQLTIQHDIDQHLTWLPQRHVRDTGLSLGLLFVSLPCIHMHTIV